METLWGSSNTIVPYNIIMLSYCSLLTVAQLVFPVDYTLHQLANLTLHFTHSLVSDNHLTKNLVKTNFCN